MTRNALLNIARVTALAVLLISSLAAVPGNQVHPPTTTPSSAPVYLAVLADHYAANEEDEFNADVENFFKRGLLVDDYFKRKAADFRVVTFFEATPPGQESRYGFTIGVSDGNCAVKDDPIKTPDAIEQTLGTENPTHVIVLGNWPYNFGCTKDTWTYVAVDAVGTDVLQHEMGHLIGDLYDEWSKASNDGATYGAVIPRDDYRNCATDPPAANPIWSDYLTDVTNEPGCDLYKNGIVRPYHDCRMGATHSKKFCTVCEKRMNWKFAYYYNPTTIDPNIYNYVSTTSTMPAVPSHVRALPSAFRLVSTAYAAEQQTPTIPIVDVYRVLVDFNPGDKKLVSRHKSFTRSAYVPNYLRVGKYVYEVRDKDKVIEVGVVPDRVFETHGSRGGAPHQVGVRGSAQFIVSIPGENQKTLGDGSRQLKIVILEVPVSVKLPPIISKLVVDKYRSQLPVVVELPLQ